MQVFVRSVMQIVPHRASLGPRRLTRCGPGPASVAAVVAYPFHSRSLGLREADGWRLHPLLVTISPRAAFCRFLPLCPVSVWWRWSDARRSTCTGLWQLPAGTPPQARRPDGGTSGGQRACRRAAGAARPHPGARCGTHGHTACAELAGQGVTEAFKACTSPDKLNLGVGAYRDDQLRPVVLQVRGGWRSASALRTPLTLPARW
jgi:hypothetical protein